MAEKLTEAKIRNLTAPANGQDEYADTDVPGMRVRIGKSGARTFILRKRVMGKPVNVTLGRHDATRFTLTDARRKARSLISDLEKGGDRLAKIRAVPATSLTIRSMLPDYVRYIRDEKENRGWAESERILKDHVLPKLGDRLADTVTRGDITSLLDGIGNASTARAAYAQLSAFYTWALPSLDNLPANPCIAARKPSAPEARDRVLDNAELAALWKATDAEPFPWRAAVKLLILTGTRRDEVFAADRSEFDLKAKLWTIPASRVKNGAKHLVPLSDAALAVIETIPQIGDAEKLFPAQRGGTGHASGYSKLAGRLRAAVEKEIAAPVDHWRLHDIRRTVATGMQSLGVRLEVTEAVLGHVSGSRAGIVGVYQRYDWQDEKRAALEAWATTVEQIVRSGK